MAGAGWCKGNINHSKEMSVLLGNLLRDSELEGDITITCGLRSFSCHKAILAARSKYFKALLYGGMKESQPGAVVEIKDVQPDTFEILLEYLYSSHISLSRMPTTQVLQLLELAHRYELILLEKDICSYLRTQINAVNAAEICQLATFYNLYQLQEHCLTLIDCNPSDSLSNLMDLSYHTLHAIIRRNSYPLTETEIFDFVEKWLGSPAHVVTDGERKVLLDDIRLSLISPEDIFLKIIPTKLFTNERILDALRDQTLLNHVDLPHRAISTNDINLVDSKLMSVTTGENANVLFTQFDGAADRPHCRHSIGDESGITVCFFNPHIVNKISFLLPSNKEFNRLYSYQVSVSLNGTTWKVIANYEDYHCHGWQHILLPQPRSVGHIKITGQWCSTSRTFCIEQMSVLYDQSQGKHDFSVDENGVIEPYDNVATIDRGAIVVEGVSRHRSTLLNGNVTHYDWEDGYTCHQVNRCLNVHTALTRSLTKLITFK